MLPYLFVDPLSGSTSISLKRVPADGQLCRELRLGQGVMTFPRLGVVDERQGERGSRWYKGMYSSY